ncbi:MAG: metallophosphoesterase family protein [Bacteroidales bacterium]|nr:metallophosphoesterase family protein [Bacteroidales bacterium]
MTKIGLLSDTHGHLDKDILNFFTDVDQIWHAGDIGNEETLDILESFKPTKAVFGNIDDHKIRIRTSEHLRFEIENKKIWITHIGGYPGKYWPHIKQELFSNPPDIFICGHSHILKVMNDPKLNLLHINPGAAGNKGWHKLVTAVRFEISIGGLKKFDIFERKR